MYSWHGQSPPLSPTIARVALARALIMDPRLLICDEPTSELDPVSARNVDDVLLRVRDALRMTVLLVTHDLRSIWRIADRVLVLGRGGIKALGTVDEVRSTDDEFVRMLLARSNESPEVGPDEYLRSLIERDRGQSKPGEPE